MNKVVIYTKTTCPYCTGAKQLLDSLNADYEEIVVDNQPELRKKLAEENNGWKTVPMIFINNKFIGGCDDLKKLHSNGLLEAKLHDPG